MGIKELLSSRCIPSLQHHKSLGNAKAEGKTAAGHHRTNPETGLPQRLWFSLWLVLHRHRIGIEQQDNLDSPDRS
jgi:hypothetical protein